AFSARTYSASVLALPSRAWRSLTCSMVNMTDAAFDTNHNCAGLVPAARRAGVIHDIPLLSSLVLDDDTGSCSVPWKVTCSPFLKQELSDCRVFGQTDGAVEGVESFLRFSESLQEVRANGPIRLIIRYGSEFNLIQCCEACTGPLRFGKGGSVSGARAE